MAFLACVVAFGAVPLPSAPAARIEVNLQPKEVRGLDLTSVPSNVMNSATLGGYDPYMGMRTLPKGYVVPKEAAGATYVRIDFNDRLENFVGVLGKAAARDRRWNKLWIDWNRDKEFSDDEAILPEEHMGGMDDEMQCFGPVQVPPGNGRPSKVCFLLEGSYQLKVLPSEIREGTLNLNGKSYRVALVDADLDGTYGSRAPVEYYGGDSLLIDLNGNGKYDGPAYPSGTPYDVGESRPIRTYVQLPDGYFYTMDFGKEGESVSFSRDPGKEGRLTGLAQGSTVTLMRKPEKQIAVRDGDPIEVVQAMDAGYPYSTSETLVAKAGKGGLLVPAGSYHLYGASFAVKDNAGKEWNYSVSRQGRDKEIVIAPGKSATFKAGAPMKLVLRAQKEQKTYYISMDLTDSNGNSVNDVTMPGGKQPPEPKLTLKLVNGKVLKTEKFHYG